MEGREMNQQRDLEGISALVTGASSGIGRAAAEELGRHGAEVIAHGRDVARGSAVVDTITAEGGKATLAAMTRAWAAEFSPSGVRVNAIAAGPVLTPGAAPERIEALGAMTLLSRAAQPSEIAEILAFLASPKASYVTGAVIAADGGRTAI
jgi:NAD(P)-dependent dehydrogenase (short-subunit alcohol dehydrogenase family)